MVWTASVLRIYRTSFDKSFRFAGEVRKNLDGRIFPPQRYFSQYRPIKCDKMMENRRMSDEMSQNLTRWNEKTERMMTKRTI
jgi:hypothetical protein